MITVTRKTGAIGMLDLTEEEKKRIRKSIIDDLTDPEVKTPADKVKLKIEVYINDKGKNDSATIPAEQVPDVNEDDVGDFPTVH
jgi:hypothetical protein